MELVEWRDPIVNSEDACPALLVPPLIASPNFLLDRVLHIFHVLLEDEWLAEVE